MHPPDDSHWAQKIILVKSLWGLSQFSFVYFSMETTSHQRREFTISFYSPNSLFHLYSAFDFFEGCWQWLEASKVFFITIKLSVWQWIFNKQRKHKNKKRREHYKNFFKPKYCAMEDIINLWKQITSSCGIIIFFFFNLDWSPAQKKISWCPTRLHENDLSFFSFFKY